MEVRFINQTKNDKHNKMTQMNSNKIKTANSFKIEFECILFRVCTFSIRLAQKQHVPLSTEP